MSCRTENVIEFLKTEFPERIQMFNTRNIVGDVMLRIYDKDGIQIDYCYRYTYIEIFGLTETEFKSVQKKMGR